jgi:glycosyltransferase involved in cell wall biosynthesis
MFRVIEDTAKLHSVRQKYELPNSFILFVGNVKPHKNIRGLMEAFKIVRQSGLAEMRLVIVGKKEGFITADRETFLMLDADAELRQNIQFTGYVESEDLPALYNHAALFVFPSFYEGFGLPPLEAMACGCPVVASKAASIPEVCGDAAYYVDPSNVESIAQGISEVLTNRHLREGLTAKGRERIKRFSWEQAAQEHIRVLDEVITN